MTSFFNICVGEKKFIPGNHVFGKMIFKNMINFDIVSSIVTLICNVQDKLKRGDPFYLVDFNNNQELINISLDHNIYQKDKETLYFDVKIPEITNLPSSIDNINVCSLYKLKIILEYFDNYTNKFVKIFNEADINITSLYTLKEIYNNPFISEPIKTNIKLIRNNKYFEYSCFIPYQIFSPNDFIPLDINFINYFNLHIKMILVNIEIKECIYFNYSLKTIVSNKIINKHKQIFICNDKYQDNILKISSLNISPACYDSIFPDQTNNIFGIEFEVLINLNIISENKNIVTQVTKIPIVINKVATNNKNCQDILPTYSSIFS